MNDQISRQNLIDHYKNPRNVGVLKKATNTVECSNVTCGDEVKVSLLIKAGKIEEIRHESAGCVMSVAGISILSEELIGMEVEKVKKLDKDALQEILGIEITPSRLKCAMLGLEAIKKALN
ncbi:iron-sulfur cluster assembly scaffold protein [Candidatus Dojkabacteria bacterium]|nr:iron-sulfur cluster assembly scaffold protein [Candidatus Dojkabacteria bacterium]